MGLNLNLKDAGSGFSIDEGHAVFDETPWADTEFVFDLEPLTQAQIDRVSRRHQKEGRGGRMKPVDQVALMADLFVLCVRGWTGIEADGKALKCTDENKAAVGSNYPDLASCVVIAAKQRRAELATSNGLELKNSGNSSNGSSD